MKNDDRRNDCQNNIGDSDKTRYGPYMSGAFLFCKKNFKSQKY